MDIEVVGAYVLFIGMAGALMVFLDAGIFAYTYPELIRLAHEGAHAMIRKRVRQMLFQTVSLCAAFAMISWMALPFLLDWIGNPVYKSAIQLYPWVLSVMIINAVGTVPHYTLYNIDICGDHAHYFDPLAPETAAERIIHFFWRGGDPTRRRCARRVNTRSRFLPQQSALKSIWPC